MSSLTEPLAVVRPRRRRWVRWGAYALSAAVVLRVILGFCLPWIVDRVAREFGLRATLDDCALSLLGGMLELRGVSLVAADDDAAPVGAVAFLRCDFDTSALLSGRLRLHRADVDGVQLTLTRGADGQLRWPRGLAGTGDATPAPTSAAAPVLARERALDLRSPVEIESMSLTRLRLAWHDEAVTPTVDTEVSLSLQLYDVGHATRPARLECDLAARDLLDALRLRVCARTHARTLELDGTVELVGAHLHGVAPYLRTLGLERNAERSDAQLRVRARLAPRVDDPIGASGDVECTLRVTSDGQDVVAVDSVRAIVEHLDRENVRLGLVHVTAPRVCVGRRADGALVLPMVDVLVGQTTSVASTAVNPPASTGSVAGLALTVARAEVEGLRIAWRDQAMQPAVELSLELPTAWATGLALGGATPSPLEAHAELVVPSAFHALTLHASARPDQGSVDWVAHLRGEGVTLAALAPYLEGANLAPALQDGVFEVAARARTTIVKDGLSLPSVRVDRVSLSDGAREWLAVEGVEVTHVALNAAGTDIERVAVQGVRARIERDENGAVRVAGVRLLEPSPSGAAAVEPAEPAPAVLPPSARAVAGFSLRELICNAGPFVWHDALPPTAGAGPTEVVIDTATIQVSELALTGRTPACRSARVTLRSTALADTIELDAELRPEGDASVLRCGLRADGLRPTAIERYLTAAGVQASFPAASLRADVRARLAIDADATLLDAEVAYVELRSGDEVFLAIPSVRLDPSRFSAQSTQIGSLSVQGPVVQLVREADGQIVVAGWRLLPLPALPAPVPVPAPVPASASPPVAFGVVRLVDAELKWRDAAVSPAFVGDIRVRAELAGLAASAAQPLTFSLEAALAPEIGTMRADGRVIAAADSVQVESTLRATGLRLARMQIYAPSNVRLASEAHDFEADLRVDIGGVLAGGSRVAVEVAKFAVRGATSATPVLAFTDATLRATRLDAAAGVFDLQKIAISGVELEVARVPEGTRLPLVTLLDAGPDAKPVPPEPVALTEPSASGPPTAGPAPSPRVTLQQLDLMLQRVQWTDLTQATPVPVVVSMRLQHAAPVTLLASPADDVQPMPLRLSGALAPLIDDFVVDLQWTPSPTEPRLSASLLARGLHAEGLAALLPGLGARIDAARSPLAEIAGKVDVGLRLSRGGIAAFDAADGFGVEAEVYDVALRDPASGRVFAGLGALRADIERVLPGNGSVHVKTIEIDDIRGVVERVADGWLVGGLLLKDVAAGESAPTATEPPEQPSTRATPSVSVSEHNTAPAADHGEVRIDTLSMSGLDFVVRDTTASPVAILPLQGLDLDVKGFTTRALHEPREIAFQGSLNGGKVELPKRRRNSSVLTGVLGAVAGAVAGGKDEFEMEQRALFDEIALQGSLRLSPKLDGWARLDLGTLELSALSPFLGSGVTLSDGVLDSGVRVRFDGAGATAVDSNFDFTNLSVTEPADGPISSYLHLPMPLDAVLFALENADDEHKIPLAFEVADEGSSGGAIAMSAASALGQLVARAVASAPLRAAGTLTGMMGLTGGEAAIAVPEELEFAAGDAALLDGAAIDRTLAALATLDGGAIVLEHVLGTDDVPRAASFANPDARDVATLAAGLRRQARALEAERMQIATQARAEMLLGVDAARSISAVRNLDVDLATVDVALGNVLDLLRKGADRRAPARTRAASRALGELRLAAVRRALIQRGGEALAERVEVRRPKAEPQSPAPPLGRVRLQVKPRAPS